MLPEERAEALAELLQGDVWLEVARPALTRRLLLIQQNVMTMVPPDPTMVSRLQGEYRLLHQLLETPERVLLNTEDDLELPMEKERPGAGSGRRYGNRG